MIGVTAEPLKSQSAHGELTPDGLTPGELMPDGLTPDGWTPSAPIESEPVVHRVGSAGAVVAVEEYGRQHRGTGTTVVFLPALGVPLSYYRRLLEHWAGRERHVLGVELRGGPQSPVADLRRESFGYSHLVKDDLPAVFALDAISAADTVVLIGHSLGGQLALLSTASGTVRPSAVVTVATGTSSPASQHTRWGRVRRRVSIRTVRTVIGVLGYWPGHRLGFGGLQPKGLMTDWAYEGRHGRYRLADDGTDYEAALARLGPPALLLDLEGDQLVPPRAVTHLADRLPAHVERRTLTGDRARDHFVWARRSPELVVDEVEDWLARAVR
jgi:predicted alpha/beta hydrolase